MPHAASTAATDVQAEVMLKDAVAAIAPAADDADSPHGTFDVILSAPVRDRDGETIKPDEWEPLPDHITFDVDHGMSVETTVGSGTPSIDEHGNLRVRGRYASTPLAQRTRDLVNDKHIRTTSVAFLRKRDRKNGSVRRELLNGSFVAVPANPAALVLDSKTFTPGRRDPDAHDSVKAAHEALSAEQREQLAQLDTKTLPDVVRAVLAALGLIDPDDKHDPPSAATETADDTAEPATERGSAEPSADEDAADSADQAADTSARAALSVRASRLRALTALPSER